jgi:hypothetical protein
LARANLTAIPQAILPHTLWCLGAVRAVGRNRRAIGKQCWPFFNSNPETTVVPFRPTARQRSSSPPNEMVFHSIVSVLNTVLVATTMIRQSLTAGDYRIHCCSVGRPTDRTLTPNVSTLLTAAGPDEPDRGKTPTRPPALLKRQPLLGIPIKTRSIIDTLTPRPKVTIDDCCARTR